MGDVTTMTIPENRGGLDTAELLFDPSRLSELVGAPVRATRLRHKSGHSTVAELIGEGGPVGWIRVMRPQLVDKVHNIVRRATQRGRKVLVRDVPGSGLRLAAGGLLTDPRLIKALDELSHRPEELQVHLGIQSADAETVFAPAHRVLRYNPMRRLLLRADTAGQPEVIRVSTERAAYLAAVTRLAAAGAPVTAPHSVGRRVSRWPWVGTTDLAALIDQGGTRWQRTVTEAGRTLSRVHTTGRQMSPAGRSADQGAQRFTSLGGDLSALDVRLGARFGQLTDRALRLSRRHDVQLIHGDCSADQVAVEADGVTTRWLDFERVRAGDVREDLGSFAATELLRAPDTARAAVTAFLAGYGGSRDAASLRPWTSLALLGRVLEPFRAAEPSWRAGIAGRLDQVEALL